MSPTPDITLLVCTRNREGDLRDLLASATQQDARDFTYDILVVDNGSTDGTASLVAAHHAADPRVRYVHEPRPGKGYALQTGVALVRAPYFAIGDDDLILSPTYLAELLRAFRADPGLTCVGGTVAPRWGAPRPGWLTEAHFEPLALTNYGDRPIDTDASRPLTLLAGAFRTETVRSLAGYRADLAVSPERTGGTEDADLMLRIYRAGLRGRYWPSALIFHKVPPQRMRRAYHRTWHRAHGASYARMRDAAFEQSRGRLLGVPLHVIRRAVGELAQWLGAVLRGRPADAFRHELHLQFAAGYVATRVGERFGRHG